MLTEASVEIDRLKQRLSVLKSHRNRLIQRLSMRLARNGWREVVRTVARKPHKPS